MVFSLNRVQCEIQPPLPNQNDAFPAINIAPKQENISPREQFPSRGASALREGVAERVGFEPTVGD